MKTIAKIVIFLMIVAMVVIAAAALELFREGYSTRRKPSATETFMARSARHMMTPAEARKMKNPYPMTPERLVEGRAHWGAHCAQCHGLDGSGNTEIGRNLYPPAPNMRLAATQSLSDGELYYIISNGVIFTGMPGWGGEHTPQETWSLVDFIRHLSRLSPDELNQMRQTAPKEMQEGQHHREQHD